MSPVRAEALSGHDRSACVKPNRHSVIVACTWRLASAASPPPPPASLWRSSVRRRAASSLSATDSRAGGTPRAPAGAPPPTRIGRADPRSWPGCRWPPASRSYANENDCADEGMTA